MTGLPTFCAPCIVAVIMLCTSHVSVADDNRRNMCPPGKWKCNENNYCIATKFRCNGVNNCNDGSDEENCDQWTCLANRWKCNNNRCVSVTSRCDGTDDCGDNSDEENCGNLRINCPSYVMEKSNLTCDCRTRLNGSHTITWPGQSQSNTLTLTNVQRSDNGTHFTCRLSSDDGIEEAVYTLLVAYGPYEGQVIISPPYLVRNNTEPVTLTCSAQDTYPTPVYEWGGLPCLKRQAGDNTCTFHPDPTYDNDNTALCRAESVVVNSYQKLDDSVTGTATGSLDMNITFLSDCGGDLVANETEQGFQSPQVQQGWRVQYPNNLYCVWRITAPVGEPLWLDFPSISIDWPGRCQQDYVKIYEGDEKTGTYLKKLCQRSWSPTMTMNGMLTVTFTSNYRRSRSGFRAAFKTIPGCYENITLTDQAQIITSPGYPADYVNNLKCVWRLTAPEGTYIKFKFIDFELQKSRGCRWDSLTFYDETSESGYRLGSYCGNKDNLRQSKFSSFTSISNSATILFKTSNRNAYRGFKVEVKATDTFKCPRLKPFQCDNLHCLPASYRCNRRNNCGDNSDEANCP